jgi:hypothetical protein
MRDYTGDFPEPLHEPAGSCSIGIVTGVIGKGATQYFFIKSGVGNLLVSHGLCSENARVTGIHFLKNKN